MTRKTAWVLAILMLIGAVQPLVANAAGPVVSATDSALSSRLKGTGPILVEGRMLLHPDAVRQIYGQRKFARIWTGATAEKVGGLLEVLRGAGADALDPADYHLAAIETLLEAGKGGQGDALDLLLTDALMAYVSDLRSGRFPPRSVDEEYAITPPAVDLPAVVKGVERSHDPIAYLQGFAPPHPDYAVLKRSLAVYREIAAKGGWPAAGPGPILKPGMQDASVPALRKRMAATGEYTGADLESDIYDPGIEAAVRLFQERNGLGADGVVGVRTRSALNISAQRRAAQIAANMERLRWLPDKLGERHVLVNIPGFNLRAVEAGAIALEMPVIVGSAVRQTPVIASKIGHMVLNPTWTIPETIAKDDVLPKLIKDPGWLASQGITVYDGWAEDAAPVDPYAIDWAQVGKKITRYRLRQAPGPLNPLGQVKFMFPNTFDIYLHDTPQREKFARDVRTLSSGCVRVGDPMGLATFLLQANPEWTPERRQQILDSGNTQTVWLRKSVPVYLLYQTAVGNAYGEVQFRPDIYDRDAPLIQALAQKRGSPAKVAAASAF